MLQNRPSRQDALWHVCPYCIENIQHQHPPSHISANLNVFDTLQHPPTFWNDETSQAESVIDGFECWGSGEAEISLKRSDLTGCDQLLLKDVCYCPSYPIANMIRQNIVCLTKLQEDGKVVQVRKARKTGQTTQQQSYSNQNRGSPKE